MENRSIAYLIDKLRSGNLEPAEEAHLKKWLHQLNSEGESGLSDEDLLMAQEEMWLEIEARRKPLKVVRLWPRIAVAAALFLCVGIAVKLYSDRTAPQPRGSVVAQYSADHKTYLTLADGKRIALNEVGKGEIAVQSGVKISKDADGQLIYEVQGDESQQNLTNTIETPKGGQLKLKLPDGTLVWLNTASRLKYPASFASSAVRRVQLLGEAYFEVAKDKAHPFIVGTTNQEVKVLGTHFNINSYQDEAVTQTTLLEGSVKVSLAGGVSKVLKPGEQSNVSGTAIQVHSIDAEEAIAWKNGYFMFNNESQEQVMRKLAHWYNIEVEYADPAVRSINYYGNVSRFDQVSKVLSKLEQTSDVRYEINGNKVKVYKRTQKR